MKDFPIDRLTRYIDDVLIRASHRRDILFRGQPVDEPLLPRIARYTVPTYSVQMERNFQREFKRKSVGLTEHIERDAWDWMALAQHHRLPTRLLDWTQNALAALWFALDRSSGSDFSPVVWILSPRATDYVETESEKSPYEGEKTQIYIPRHSTRRITVQAGLFTVHKYVESSSKFIPLERQLQFRRRLHKLEIDRKAVRRLKYELDCCGINAATLFPDLEGLTSYMRWEYARVDKYKEFESDPPAIGVP